MVQSQSVEASPGRISATGISTKSPSPSKCKLSTQQPSLQQTTTCFQIVVDPCESKLSTPLKTQKKCRFTQRTRRRQRSSRPTWTVHRKSRSSSSSVSAGKSSHGVQLTCQEYPGNLPSTHLIWILKPDLYDNLFAASQSRIARPCYQKSIASSRLDSSKK